VRFDHSPFYGGSVLVLSISTAMTAVLKPDPQTTCGYFDAIRLIPVCLLCAVDLRSVFVRGRMGGMKPNPYESPQHFSELAAQPAPAKPIPRWVWVVFWIVIPLAIANAIIVIRVLVAELP
jgi:hypothetical protein